MIKPEVTCYQSPIDGAWVVEIDTDAADDAMDANGEPRPLRVYLNEAVLYANPDIRCEAQLDDERRST